MADPFLDRLQYVGDVKARPKRDDFLTNLEYKSDIPTFSGQVQEAGTRFLRDAGTSAVAAPLKGASIFESWRERNVDEGLRSQIDAALERAKNPIRPGDRTNATRDLRRIANLYLDGDEKKDLWSIADRLEKGEAPEEELKKEAEAKLPFYVPSKPPEERKAYKAGQAVEKFLEEKLPTKPGYEDTTGVAIGGALGSTAGTITQSLIGGPVTAFAGAALMGVEEQHERATKAGLKGDEAVDYAMQGAGPGAIGMLSAEYILRKLPPAVRSKVIKHATDVAGAGVSEAVTEGLQQTLQNAIERQYNKERDVFDGTLFAAGMGGSAGAILRGVILASTRGKGVGAGGEPPDFTQVQTELAKEEFKIRQEGTADAEIKAPGRKPERAKSPKEAAQKGEVTEPGRPATVIYPHGEVATGYVRTENPDGSYEFVDRDGVIHPIHPDDYKDPNSPDARGVVLKGGWLEQKSDEDVVKTLSEWLERDTPWTKVTVENEEGVRFKAVEGPPQGDLRSFRDGNGKLHQLNPDVIDVVQGWDPEAYAAPEPFIGHRDEALSKAGTVTKADEDSVIDTDLIAGGKRAIAESEGTNKANRVLQAAALPPVGTRVRYTDENGKTNDAVVSDASIDAVEITNSEGVNIARPISEMRSRISIPSAREEKEPKPEDVEKIETAPPEPDLPPFFAPGGRLLPKSDVKDEKAASAEFVPDTKAMPIQEFLAKGVATDDQGERKESRPRVEDRKGAGDKTQHREGQTSPSQARVRDTDVKKEKEQVDERQTARSDEPRSQEDRPDTQPSPAATEGRRTDEIPAYPKQEPQRVRQEDLGAPRPKKTEEGPTPPQSKVETSKAGSWWDNADTESRAKVVKEVGYDTLGSQSQGRRYSKQAWTELPEATKARISERTDLDFKSKPAPEVQVKDTTEIPLVEAKSQGLEFRKNGQPFDSADSAMMVVSRNTHEPVKVEGGWARRPLKPSDSARVPESKPKIESVTEAKPLSVFPEGVNVQKNGTPFSTYRAAMLQAGNRAKKGEGPFEAVEIEGGWGYRHMGKPRQQVKKVLEKQEAVEAPVVEKPKARRVTKKEIDAEKRKALRDQLRKELDDKGLKDVRLETPETIQTKDVGKKAVSDTGVIGRSVDDLIEVALDGEHDPRKVMNHEVVHAMRNMGLFNDMEWRTLEREASADTPRMESVRQRYSGDSLSESELVEEAIADRYAEYADGLATPKGFVRRAFEKIRDLLRSIRNVLNGNGFRTSSDVFEAIESGEIGARPRNRTARQIAASEADSKAALEDLQDPTGRLISKERFARVARDDQFFVEDIGWARKLIVSPRTIAAFNPEFSPVYGTAKDQFGYRQSVIATLADEYKPYRDIKKAESKKKIDKVLELGRLEQTVYTPASNGTITVTASQQTANMKAGETVTLTPEEVKGYQSVRSMMDKALDIFKAQTVRDHGFDPAQVATPAQAMSLITPQTTKAEAKRIKQLAKFLNDIEQSKRVGYVPFTRFGNVVVLAETIDPNTGKRTTLHSETIEVKGLGSKWHMFKAGKLGMHKELAKYRDIRDAMARLKKQYPGANIRKFQVASKEDNRPAGERDTLAELFQLPQHELKGRIDELYTDAMAKGFRKHFIASKNIPGYSADIERNIADYVITLGGYASRRKYQKQWDESIRNIPDPMVNLKRYAEDYRDYVNNPHEEFAGLRQAGFVMMLMGNTSNAAANMTQVPLVTAPYLSMFGNTGRVEFELARAYKDVTMMIGGGTKDIFDPSKAPADVRNALQAAWEAGEFTPLAMHDIMGTAYNNKSSSQTFSKNARNVIDFLAIPQIATERANRLVTYIAAYRMARKPGFEAKARDILGENAFAAETVLKNYSEDAFARFVVDETQYDVGKINRAKMMRGAGAAIFQFKPFQAHTIELYFKLNILHGRRGKLSFALMMAGLIGSAGLWALPGGDDSIYLLEKVLKWWDGVDRDIKATTREIIQEMTSSQFFVDNLPWIAERGPKTAEVMTQGLFRALGMDMSNRIGMGKIVPRTTEELGGVPLSLLWGRGESFLSNIKEGKWLQAGSSLAPLAAKNFIDAWIWGTEGVRTKYGDLVMTPEEISQLDMASKGLGWTPSKVAERREMEWSQQRASKAVQDLKTKYYRNLARTIADMNEAAGNKDVEKLNELKEKYKEMLLEIAEHNKSALEKRHIHKVIVLDRRALTDRVKAEYVGRGRVRETKAPKAARPRQQELRRIYGQ